MANATIADREAERLPRPCDPVRWTAAGDVVLLFSVATGRFAALEGAAAVMWRGIADGSDQAAIVREIAESFDAETLRISADFWSFCSTCVAQGWLAFGRAPPAREDPPARLGRLCRAWPVFHAAWARRQVAKRLARRAPATSSTARRAPFESAYSLARSAATLPTSAFLPGTIDRLLRAFRRADAFPSAACRVGDCLPRSLALFLFLRQRGVAATHLIGVTPRPFAAHAWVEVDGSPVLEDEERVSRFVRLAELA